MSDDGDTGLATPEEQDAAIDHDMEPLVRMWVETYAIPKRRVYDGLIRWARLIRGGQTLDEIE